MNETTSKWSATRRDLLDRLYNMEEIVHDLGQALTSPEIGDLMDELNKALDNPIFDDIED